MTDCPKHIGLVGPLPPPFGGMANQTQQLAELLRSEGLTVSLVQTNADYRPRWVSRIPVIRAIFRLVPYLFALRKLTKKVDIIHVMANSGWSWHLFTTPAVWIAKLCDKPVIVNYHGGEAASFLAKAAKPIKATLRHTATLIVPSGFLLSVFKSFDIASTIVPNVIDIECFSRTTHSLPLRRLLVSRNLEPIYDNETAIRAFSAVCSRYHDTTLTIAGSGPQENSLRALVKQLGLDKQVTFTGRLNKAAMVDAYKSADIAINPSQVDNMPISLLEALACGIPIVSTNVGGIPDLVKDEQTALLVQPRSPDAMAKAILRLMDDSDLSEKLIHNGLVEVQKYTWQRVWPVLAAVYSEASHANRLPA